MEQLIINVDNIVLGFVQGSFGSLSGTIHVLWRLMFIVFIAVYGYKIMISGRFSASDLLTHCLKIVVLLVLATQWNTFFQFVYRMVTDMPSDIAGHLLQASSASLGAQSQADNVMSANTALSEFYMRVMKVSDHLLEGTSWTEIGPYLYAFCVWLAALGFAGYATMLIILSKLAVALLLAIGPLFILLLIFNDTRQLFESWLKTLLNYAIIPVFVYALLALLLSLEEAPLKYMERHSGVADQLITVIGPFLLVTLVATILLAQVMNLAGSVTGGISLSTMGAGGMAWRASKVAGATTGLAAAGVATAAWKKTKPYRTKATDYASRKIEAGRVAIEEALKRRGATL